MVAGRGVDRNTLVLELLKDGGEHRVGLVIHAAELSEGQVHDVGVQDHHVVEGGEQRRVGDVAVFATRDLRDDDLSLGGHADDLVGVAGSDAGDVRSVGTVGPLGRHRVVVAVRVVVGEGELLRDVHSQLSVAQLRGQGRNLVLGKPGGPVQGTRERGMGHLDAGVDDGDNLALALLGELVGVHHDLGAEVVGVLGGQSGRLRAALGIDLVDVAEAGIALKECGLDAAHRADRVERAGGRAQRESFEGLVVLALHLGRFARECRGHGLVDGSEGCRAVRTLVQLHDDANDRGGVLLGGRRNLVWLRGLSALRGESGVDVAHGQGRGRGTGSGVGVRGRRCECRGPRQGERAGAGERKERRWFLRCHVRTPMCRRATVLAGGGNSVVPATTVKIQQRTLVTNFVSHWETIGHYFTVIIIPGPRTLA